MSLGQVYNTPPPYAAAARDVRCHCVASLTFLVWDCVIVWDDEVQHVWVMRHKNPFKWVYLLMRYGVIVAHVMHNLFFDTLISSGNPRMVCRAWYSYIAVLSQVTQTLLEFILSCRVFALYNRSKKVAFLLAILILAELGGTIRILSLGDDPLTGYYGTCLLQAMNPDAVKQSILGLVVHCTLIALTLFKYIIALRAGWGRTPLVSLVVRDNTVVYGAIIFLVATVVVTCNLYNERGVAVFYWATALASMSGSRMILGMERFARQETVAESPNQLFLTSGISLGTFQSGNGSRHGRPTSSQHSHSNDANHRC